MEKEELNNQDALQPSPHNTIKEEEADQSLRKPPQGSSVGGGSGSIGGGSDRLKRDEWSEGAVSSLLDAYESKWVLRNRAKLKGHDWEDVARYVSSRANSTKSPKTQTQCKNKIESMKKRYRSESAAATADASSSSWPLFHRLDLLLRCRTNNLSTTTTTITSTSTHQPPMAVLLDHHPPPIQSLPPPVALTVTPSATATQLPPLPPPLPPPTSIGIHQNSHESNGVDLASKEEGVGTKTFEDGSDRVSMEMDSSTPMSETVKDKLKRSNKEIRVEKSNKIRSRGKKKGRRIRDHNHELELASSIRWLAEVMVRSEQARMDMIREVEKMRVEAEAKRGEMDLKRTEIMANTQLQIAQILAGSNNAKSNIDSALRIGRS